jgi:hypothetical protein
MIILQSMRSLMRASNGTLNAARTVSQLDESKHDTVCSHITKTSNNDRVGETNFSGVLGGNP